MSRDVLRDRKEKVLSVSICPGILRCKTLDLGLKKQRELPGYPRFPTLKQRSTGYLCLAQGTAENQRNLRTLRLLCRNKKACEIVGLHRLEKQIGGVAEIRTHDLLSSAGLSSGCAFRESMRRNIPKSRPVIPRKNRVY